MRKIYIISSLLFMLLASQAYGQVICDAGDQLVVTSRIIPINSYSLIPVSNVGGSMYYCSELMNADHGGGFQLAYADNYDGGMDGYPNVRAGGAKVGGRWQVGDKAVVGMPVQIKDINPKMSFKWESTQENAWDNDDKWMSSINFIFDIEGTENSEPDNSKRDYDLVVKAQSHNFSDDLDDQSEVINNKMFFFARNADGSLKPYETIVNGTTYTYAIRYKFFMGMGDKDDKAHIKLIPYGEHGAPPVAEINIKHLIVTTRDYIQYANIPEPQCSLAYEKIGGDDTWLKAIAAGYEVYTGESSLRVDQFKVFPQGESPTAIIDNEEKQLIVYPNPSNGVFFIKGSDIVRIEVYNLQGQLMHEELNSKQLNLSYLKSGQYLMRITTCNGKVEMHKVQFF